MLGDYVSTTQKIQNAYEVREHALKALELKPGDASTLHLLGRWSLGVARVTWLERKVAQTLFASPPSCTYDDALQWFLKAQEEDPKLVRNSLLIGDTYMLLNMPDKANEWYKKTAAMQPNSNVDNTFIEEAKGKIK